MDWFELTRCWTGTIDCILIFFFLLLFFFILRKDDDGGASSNTTTTGMGGTGILVMRGWASGMLFLSLPFFSSSSFLVTTFSRSIRGRVGGGGVVVGGIEEVKHDNFPARSNALVTLQSLHKEKRSFPFFFSF